MEYNENHIRLMCPTPFHMYGYSNVDYMGILMFILICIWLNIESI